MTKGFVMHVPHNHALGMEVLEVADGVARFRLPWAEHLVGNPELGVLHGGPITALLDACCGAAVFAAAREAGTLGALINEIPYARWLGLGACEDGGELIVTMRYTPHLIGNAALPALHGGTLGALLESAAIFELLWRSETLVLPKTI